MPHSAKALRLEEIFVCLQYYFVSFYFCYAKSSFRIL